MSNKCKAFALFVVLIITAATGQSQTPRGSKKMSPEQYIRESESQWAASVATGEVSVLERILADDFVGVDPKGSVYNKASMISDTRSAPKYFKSNHIDSVQIRFFGNAAVAHGSETWERHDGSRGRFVWIDTWIKRKGKWQIVAAEDLIAPIKDVNAPVPK